MVWPLLLKYGLVLASGALYVLLVVFLKPARKPAESETEPPSPSTARGLRKVFLFLAIPFGLLSGILWFGIGEALDNHLGNTLAWFAAPLLAPCLIAGAYAVRKGPTQSWGSVFLFVLGFYIYHWMPMSALLFAMLALNMKM